MKPCHLIAGSICALALSAAAVGGFVYLTEQHTPPPAIVPTALRQQLRTGDILFSEGHSLKSDLVRLTGRNEAESEVSHTGFIQRRGEALFVTHMSIDDGRMMSEPLNTFIRRNQVSRLYFTRLHTPFDRERLALVLDSLLSLPMPFDNRFRMEDDTEYYCTELIVKTLHLSGCYTFDSLFLHSREVLYPARLMQINALQRISLKGEQPPSIPEQEESHSPSGANRTHYFPMLYKNARRFSGHTNFIPLWSHLDFLQKKKSFPSVRKAPFSNRFTEHNRYLNKQTFK